MCLFYSNARYNDRVGHVRETKLIQPRHEEGFVSVTGLAATTTSDDAAKAEHCESTWSRYFVLDLDR